MAFIDYRIKEINQKVSKDYAIQSDIGKHLKDNLKIYNVIRSNNKEILSNYEEEERSLIKISIQKKFTFILVIIK